MDVDQLIAAHGAYSYLIAFVWTFLEGETIVLFAGFAAAHGLLNPILVLVAAWLGSFSGDQLYFWIGRPLPWG
jgi:membrane protein DedA with SNARE-associated domain